MQGKSPDKLMKGKCYLLFDACHSIILVVKCHVLVVNALDSIIVNGDFESMSSQIFYHRLWTSKSLFGKNNSRFFAIIAEFARIL